MVHRKFLIIVQMSFMLALIFSSCQNSHYPFAVDNLAAELQEQYNSNLLDFEYNLVDVDSDGNPELFLRDKEGTYYVYLIDKDTKKAELLSYTASNVDSYAYTDDGYLVYQGEFDDGSVTNYYKLQESKVILKGLRSASIIFDDTEGKGDYQTDYSVTDTRGNPLPEAETAYNQNYPKQKFHYLADITTWQSFMGI